MAPPSPADALLKILKHPRYQPENETQLFKKMKLPSQARKTFHGVVEELELKGVIARVKGDRWVLAKEAELVTGVIQFHPKGFAFLMPENGGEEIFIPAEETGTAMHQDLVVARLSSERSRHNKDQDRKEGRVIRLLRRRRERIVGTLQRSNLFWFIVPDDPRFVQSIYVPDPNLPAPAKSPSVRVEVEDKVVVQLIDWKSRHVNPEGIIVERLGRSGDAGVDILSIIRKHELPTEFPVQALGEVVRLNPETQPRPEPGRLDLRTEFIITIDPDTAKDFDDAISIRELDDHEVEVGIHIADVSHYVQPGTALDKEAQKRANSTYLVNQVIPMLPEELSNGLCSLMPMVNRHAFSAFVHLDSKCRIKKSRFAKTLIRSRHRLTYHQALERLSRAPQDELDQFLHRAWEIAGKLRQQRMYTGSLDLDMPEVKVILDDQGSPQRLQRTENDISHQLIEEFMLLANEAVAASLRNRHTPALYRVHEQPDEEKLQELRDFMLMRGVKIGDLTKRRELQKLIEIIRSRPDEQVLKIQVLKSLKRACYLPKPLGHFGLAKNNYTHFTSPIRRYADLVVHRALHSQILNRPPKLGTDDLSALGRHLSDQERVSSEAEQDSTRLKILEYFAQQLESSRRTVFGANVTEVMNYGFFVQIPEFLVSGLVHLSSLQDDFYTLDPRKGILRGKHSRKIIEPGQALRVEVSRIDIFKRQIDFRVVT